jgi:hypothetical protein
MIKEHYHRRNEITNHRRKEVVLWARKSSFWKVGRAIIGGFHRSATRPAPHRRVLHRRAAQRQHAVRLPECKGQLSSRINDQYRICFKWGATRANDVEITDYH